MTTINLPDGFVLPPGIDWWPPPQGAWTVADYLRISESEGIRYEVIDGDLHMMSPAPTPRHQHVALELVVQIRQHLAVTEPLGEVFISPIDVELDDRSIVQPDAIFVTEAQREIVDLDRRVIGMPAWMSEVLSPSGHTRDKRKKLELYQRHGVIEYWILDPARRTVEPHVRRGEQLVSAGVFTGAQPCPSEVIPGFQPLVASLFPTR